MEEGATTGGASWREWVLKHRRVIAPAVAALGLLLGSVIGWQLVATWKAGGVARQQDAWARETLDATDTLNARIDALLDRLPADGQPVPAGLRREILEAVTAMARKVESLEAEAQDLRAGLANRNAPWPTTARDAVANTLFRIESLRARAEAVTVAEKAKPVETDPVQLQPGRLVDVSKGPGTAVMIVTPESLRRAREIGAAYHRRQRARFAGATYTRLPSAAGSHVAP